MSQTKNTIGRLIGLLSGLALLSTGLIGCQTSSRTFEHDWSVGAGGSAMTSSSDAETGYGPQVNVRRRISDHFKVELQGNYTTHEVDGASSTQKAYDFDATTATLTGQYEFMPSDNEDLRFFVGGGGAYGWFSNESPNRSAGVTDVQIEDDEAGVAEVGLRVPWGFHLKVSRFFDLQPEGSVTGADYDLDEDNENWLFSAGLNIPF